MGRRRPHRGCHRGDVRSASEPGFGPNDRGRAWIGAVVPRLRYPADRL